MATSPRPFVPAQGAALLAHNFVKAMTSARHTSRVLEVIDFHGAQPMRDLARLTGLCATTVRGQLRWAKTEGLLVMYGSGKTRCWGFPGRPPAPKTPHRTAPALRRSSFLRAPAKDSWWLSVPKDQFQAVARSRARQAGWES